MVNNAPGLKTRRRKNGEIAHYWVSKSVSRHAKTYPTKSVRLHGDEETIAQRCRVLTGELREWLSERGRGEPPKYDGSLRSLIRMYQQTPESPYQELKHNTRAMYDESLALLETTVGKRQLARLTGLDFRRWHTNLKAPAEHTEKEIAAAKEAGIPIEPKPERLRRAYKAMQLLRIVVKFGVVMDIQDCFRLVTVLEQMRFTSPKARSGALTFEHMTAFCNYAIKEGQLSMALAQAFQFELTLRQIDVIGEWIECDPNESGIVYKGKRWINGLLWSHIDENGVLVKTTTKTGQVAEHDTTAYPFLRSIMERVPAEKRVGPIVKAESNGLPYRYRYYSRKWRELADAVGIPKEIWNRDSRAGGVTEGSDAGADIEHLRHHANHSNIATTGRYNRHTIDKTRKVAELRVAHRDGKNAS